MFLRLILLFSIISVASFGQDHSNFSHYFMNPYSINPSYAGTDGRGSLFLTYRMQWAGLEGAPNIANASFHTPVGKRLGFGINVSNAERGVLNTSSAVLSNSIGISLTDKFILRFGASVGAASNSVDLAQLDNIDPNILPDITDGAIDNNLYLVGSAGISLQAKQFNFGISIPNIFQDQYYGAETFTVGDVSALENLLIFASNRFYLTKKKKHIIEPFILYRYSDVLPPLFEGSLVVHLNHTVWFGGSYRQNFGISALGGIKLNKVFGLGYSYSLQNSGANEINSPTHEVQLNLLLGGRKKKRFVYSFVDSALPKKKSKRQLALEERRKKLEEQRKLAEEQRKQEEEQKKAEAEKLAEQQAREQRLENERKALEQQTAQAEAQKQQEADRLVEEEAEAQRIADEKAESERKLQAQREAERVAALEKAKEAQQALESKETTTDKEDVLQPENVQETQNNVQSDNPSREEQPDDQSSERVNIDNNLIDRHTSNERVRVKRGGHLLELTTGEYVIVGVFESYEHAEEYSDNLFFKGYKSKFGYISQEGYWYVYVFESNDIEEARAKRDELRQKRIFSKAWVITIE